MVGICKSMPSVSWDEDRSASLKRVMYVVEYDSSAAIQNVKGFFHLEMPMDRYACTEFHLLRP